MAAVEEGVGEAGVEVGEGGVALNHHYAGVAADVAEGFVVRAGYDVAAVAAHEAELRAKRVVIPWSSVLVRAGGGVGGVGVVGGGGGDWEQRERRRWWWIHGEWDDP